MKWLRCKIHKYFRNRRQRQQLLMMDEQMRKDLAISRVDAERYAGRYQSKNKKLRQEERSDERNQLAGLRTGRITHRNNH